MFFHVQCQYLYDIACGLLFGTVSKEQNVEQYVLPKIAAHNEALSTVLWVKPMAHATIDEA